MKHCQTTSPPDGKYRGYIHHGDQRLDDLCAPVVLDQLEELIVEVEALRAKAPQGYVGKNASKRLAAITRLMLNDIPQGPSGNEYQQGSTLGAAHRRWRRAKFFQQYRLFFRFHTRSRLIVLGWVNDTDTMRAYGSKSDAYRVFQLRLASGHPPNNWEELLQEAAQGAELLPALPAKGETSQTIPLGQQVAAA